MPLPTKPHADSTTFDSFGRADTTTGVGTADCRLDWVGDTGLARLVSGAVQEVTPGTGRIYCILDGYSDYQWVEIAILTSPTTNTTDVGPVARSSLSVAGGVGKRLYARIRKIAGQNAIALMNQNPVTAGSDTVVAQNTSAGLADNTTYTIALEVTAAGLATVYVNGTPVTGVTNIDISALDLPGRGSGITINRGNDGGSRILSFDTRHSGTRQSTAAQIIAHRASIAALGDEAEEKIATLAELPAETNGIEIDVRLSSDGVPVLNHDTTVDRTTTGSGTVSAMTFAELDALGVAAFEAFLDECAASHNFNTIFAQLMVPDADLATAAAVADAHPLKDRIILMAATQSALDNLRAAYDGRIGNYGVTTANVASFVSAAQTETAEVLYVTPGDADYLTNRAAVADIHAGSLDAGASTVNAGETIRAADTDGVEYILTDRADLVSYAYSAPALPVIDLVVADSAHTHTAEAVTLTQAHELVVADSAHAHSAESVALTQGQQLAVDESAHGHTTESVALTQVHVLSVDSSSHGHTTESVVVTQVHELTVADALHEHATEAVALTQAHSLSVDDATHTHTTENVSLTGGASLTVADSFHAHTSDAVSLTQVHGLVVDDAAHSHVVGVVAITQTHVLEVADSLHAHTADEVTIVDASIEIPNVLSLAAVGDPRTLVAVPSPRTLAAVPSARTLVTLED